MERKKDRRNDETRNSFFMKDRRENSSREARDDNNRGNRVFERNESRGRRSFNPNFDRNNRLKNNIRRGEESDNSRQDFREQNYRRGEHNVSDNRRRFSQEGREFREENQNRYRERNFNREQNEEDYNRQSFLLRRRRERGQKESQERDYNRETNYNSREQRSYNREQAPYRQRNFENNRQGNFRGEFNERSRFRGNNDSYRRTPRYANRIFEGNTKRIGAQDRDELHGTIVSNFMEPLLNREIRLNRYIAMSGICSRREADEYIQRGVVSVNGTIVTELGTKIKAGDEVCFNNEVIHGEKRVYIVLNKPKGYVTTMDDPNADHTVMELLQDKVEQRVYPVGRLDKNTMGVLLLTNDGDLAKELTHPSYMKKKIYHVFLDKKMDEADMERLTQGIELEDGPAYVDEISYVGDTRKEVGVEIHNGRNRIVRRLFENLGYRIQKLDRVYFAGLTKKGLQRGMWRYLTTQEISMLKSGSYQ